MYATKLQLTKEAIVAAFHVEPIDVRARASSKCPRPGPSKQCERLYHKLTAFGDGGRDQALSKSVQEQYSAVLFHAQVSFGHRRRQSAEVMRKSSASWHFEITPFAALRTEREEQTNDHFDLSQI